MILHPGLLALVVSALVVLGMAAAGAGIGLQILRRWDLTSGSELQLILERRTTLVSTLLAWAFSLELLSLFLFVGVSDGLHSQFVGAMCAAGVLNASRAGYPLLYLKTANVLICGTWLIINHTDTRAPDYPLIRAKYLILLGAAPLLAAEAVLLFFFAGGLKPHIITSCCGSLFSSSAETAAADIASLPALPMMIVFAGSILAAVAAAAYCFQTGRGGVMLAMLSLFVFAASIASVLSWIAPYVYELPAHHCPFCLLQREYRFVGYVLYSLLFAGTISGLGAGALSFSKKRASLAETALHIQKRCAGGAAVAFSVFGVLVVLLVVVSNLSLL